VIPTSCAGEVNIAGKLYLVIESVRPDTRHGGHSTVPVPADGAGVGLQTEGVRAVRSLAPRSGHSGRRCAFVCADDKAGAIPGVKTGANTGTPAFGESAIRWY
jgi:hypothetical protein